jgi:hypothetical protein
MTRKLLYTLVIFLFIFSACNTNSAFDKQKETQAIKALLQQERKAHFDRNVELFISEFADSMISVNKGKVSVATSEENKERIGGYFNSVKFIKWDDVAEPIIRISDDGSMAYAIIQKQVILSQPDSLGKTFIDTTDYAWVSVYRMQKGEWKVECNASTSPQTP